MTARLDEWNRFVKEVLENEHGPDFLPQVQILIAKIFLQALAWKYALLTSMKSSLLYTSDAADE